MEARAEGAAERTPLGTLERAAALFLVAFLLVFPKGGIKVGEVPLTWGYLALAPLSLALPLAWWAGRRVPLTRARLVALGALLPFQLLSWTAFLAFGAEGAGFLIAFLIVFFFLPPVFVLAFADALDRVDLPWLLGWVRRGIFLVAAYGIFLFFFRMATGRFLEIPLLTINLGDVGALEGKHIDRGGIFKLISTYNNGNIYGVSLLLLLPLYSWLERSVVRTSVVKFSLVLTLSRTVWIGLVLHEVLYRLYVRRVSAKTVATLVLWLVPVLAGVLAMVRLLEVDALEFLFDPNLGGRAAQIERLREVTLLPSERYVAVEEVVYASVLRQFGIVGLAAYLVAVGTPLALYALRAVPDPRSPFKRAVAAGLAIWMVVSMSDGALLFIPVMAFFWFLVSLLLSDNPTWAAAAPAPPPARAARRAAPAPEAA